MGATVERRATGRFSRETTGGVVRRLGIFALIALPTIGVTSLAHGHSWYPHECCSDRDCEPADTVDTDATGHMIVVVGRRRIWIPFGLESRLSPDGRVHICFRVLTGELDGSTFTMPLCLFMPAQS